MSFTTGWVRSPPVSPLLNYIFEDVVNIAKNLKKHGLTETDWTDGPGDGLGAMVGGWYCDKKYKETGEPMYSFDYMKGIESYNRVDCKVMWELINYLRENHC